MVARLNTNGSLDAGFGSGGTTTVNFGTTNAVAHSLALQSDGKIVVVGGEHTTGINADFLVARLNTNGSLDTGFDIDGKVTVDFGGNVAIAYSVAIQSNQKIVLAGGESTTGINADFFVARLNTNGSLDTGFDLDGKVTVDFGTNVAVAHSVAIQSDGKIIAAGGYGNFAIARLNTSGSLDTSFDTDGKVTVNFGANEYAYSVAIHSDGKIVVAGGEVTTGINADFMLARLNMNGSLDTGFDIDGKVTTDFGTNVVVANGVAIQSDEKIVAAGGYDDFAVARYIGISCASLAINPTTTGDGGSCNGTATASASGGTPPYTWNWSGPSCPCANADNITGLCAGTYSVTVTDNNGCTLVGSPVIVIGIEEIPSLTSLTLYPNPSEGEFTIEMELAQPLEMELELFNALGQVIHSESLGRVSGTYQKQLSLKALAKGIYSLQLTSEEGTTTRKLMIE